MPYDDSRVRVSRRRFVQGAAGAAALLALPGRLVAWPIDERAQGTGGAPPDRYAPIVPRFAHILHGGD